MRVITDPTEAADVRRRLIDPRQIQRIVLVATADQPAITGYPSPTTLPISAFAAVNPTCHAIFKQLKEPPISSHVVPGAGLSALAEGAATFALEEMGKLGFKARAYMQVKNIPGHREGRTGPKEFALLTFLRDDAVPQSDVAHIEAGELVPSHDAAGGVLIELPSADDPALAAHLERNRHLWDAWARMGVTEQTELPVDFQFFATRQAPADALRQQLESQGLSVATERTRTLLIFKGWQLTATEKSRWTLARLQTRTRELFEAAAKLDVTLESIGAAIQKGE